MITETGKIEVFDDTFYCDAKFLANALDLTKGRISQMAADGQLVREETEEGPLFPLIDTLQTYWSRKQSEETEEDRKIRRERAKAEVTIKKSRATIAKLEAQELEGKMFRAEDIKAITEDYLYEIRSQINALPGQLAVDVSNASGAAECAAIIRTGINRMLMNLQKYRFDPSKYEERVRERKKWEAYKHESESDDD